LFVTQILVRRIGRRVSLLALALGNDTDTRSSSNCRGAAIVDLALAHHTQCFETCRRVSLLALAHTCELLKWWESQSSCRC